MNIEQVYQSWYGAFAYYNETLFDGKLPPVLIVMDRSCKKAKGTYHAASWISRHDEDAKPVDQIIMNPDLFNGRTDAEILSTFVHEMVHHWQEHFGVKKRGHHNAEWGGKMEALGLTPVPCKPDGKTTGKHVTHEIARGGAFDEVTRMLIESGHKVEFQILPSGDPVRAKKKAASKTKFTCVRCDANAWGKPDTHILCGSCSTDLNDLLPMIDAEFADVVGAELAKRNIPDKEFAPAVRSIREKIKGQEQ